MIRVIRNIVISIISGLICFTANAQTNQIHVTGLFTEKTDAEVSIVAKDGKKALMMATYRITKSNSQFALAIPFVEQANYVIDINLLKMGHIRFETDKRFSFPLNMNADKNLALTITPSALDTAKKTGIIVDNKKSNLPLATISGSLKNSYIGGEFFLQRANKGSWETIESIRSIQTKADSFCFTVPVLSEGLYCISTMRWQKRFYLKPSDNLLVNIDCSNGSFQWIKSSEENIVLKQWEDLINPITKYGYFSKNTLNYGKINIDSFVISHKELQPSITALIAKTKTANDQFNTLFKTVAAVDNSCSALNLLYYLSADIKDQISHARLLLQDTINAVRKIAFNLRPMIIDDVGLIAAIQYHANEFQTRTGIICHFTDKTNETIIEDKDLTIGVYRIFQESLTNITRHAQATIVDSSIKLQGGHLILTVKDNGVGFDPEAVRQKKSLGLIGMRERAKLINGQFTIKSKPGEGTLISIKIPLSK